MYMYRIAIPHAAPLPVHAVLFLILRLPHSHPRLHPQVSLSLRQLSAIESRSLPSSITNTNSCVTQLACVISPQQTTQLNRQLPRREKKKGIVQSGGICPICIYISLFFAGKNKSKSKSKRKKKENSLPFYVSALSSLYPSTCAKIYIHILFDKQKLFSHSLVTSPIFNTRVPTSVTSICKTLKISLNPTKPLCPNNFCYQHPS